MSQIVIREVLGFYDGEDGTGNSAAINGMLGEELALGLLTHYLRGSGYRDVAALEDPCTQGTPSGPRLDRWVRVVADGGPRLFQVEIKNWCAHSLGGRVLPIDAGDLALADHARRMWHRYWNDAAGRPRDKALQKVLEPMRRPTKYGNLAVSPVACVWDVLHSSGALEPWFDVAVAGPFERLHWFSMSAYLRSLARQGHQQVHIDMPLLENRLRWIDRMIPTGGAASSP